MSGAAFWACSVVSFGATVMSATGTGGGEAGAPAAPTLDSVINGLRTRLVGVLAAVATLFLTLGGIRYITAGGDPMHVERAKTALKSAAIGYALAVLSPLLVAVLRSVVGCMHQSLPWRERGIRRWRAWA